MPPKPCSRTARRGEGKNPNWRQRIGPCGRCGASAGQALLGFFTGKYPPKATARTGGIRLHPTEGREGKCQVAFLARDPQSSDCKS